MLRNNEIIEDNTNCSINKDKSTKKNNYSITSRILSSDQKILDDLTQSFNLKTESPINSWDDDPWDKGHWANRQTKSAR